MKLSNQRIIINPININSLDNRDANECLNVENNNNLLSNECYANLYDAVLKEMVIKITPIWCEKSNFKGYKKTTIEALPKTYGYGKLHIIIKLKNGKFLNSLLKPEFTNKNKNDLVVRLQAVIGILCLDKVKQKILFNDIDEVYIMPF